MFTVDTHDDRVPKRGDIFQTNIGNPRERTWIVLRSRAVNGHVRRFKVWAARWWELEPEMRMRLYRSAERNGGQRYITFYRYRKAKQRKPLFALPS